MNATLRTARRWGLCILLALVLATFTSAEEPQASAVEDNRAPSSEAQADTPGTTPGSGDEQRTADARSGDSTATADNPGAAGEQTDQNR